MLKALDRLTRRDLMKASAAFAAAAATPSALLAQAASTAQGVGALPARGEFVIRGATILTMDPTLGDIAGGDIHVRDGAIIAIGRGVVAPGASATIQRYALQAGAILCTGLARDGDLQDVRQESLFRLSLSLQGQVESFDQYVILLKNTVTQMVYKHAISTIVPARSVTIPPDAE